jgi:hypothetical protein
VRRVRRTEEEERVRGRGCCRKHRAWNERGVIDDVSHSGASEGVSGQPAARREMYCMLSSGRGRAKHNVDERGYDRRDDLHSASDASDGMTLTERFPCKRVVWSFGDVAGGTTITFRLR